MPDTPPLTRATAEDAGRVAQTAGVKALVLSHLVPAEDPHVTDQMWIAAASAHFDGEVIAGKDFMRGSGLRWIRPGDL